MVKPSGKFKLILVIALWAAFGLAGIVASGNVGADDLSSRFPETLNEKSSPRSNARIVFSGHSLTDVAVPTIIEVAQSKGIDLKSIYQSVPGSTMRYRTEGPPESGEWGGYGQGVPDGVNLIKEFRDPSLLPGKERFDILVITERHDILGTIQWESTLESLYHFHNRLLESSRDGQTYFYQSWLGIDKSNPEPWVEYERNSLKTWECITSKTNLTLSSQNQPENVRTIGAGWALSHMVKQALDNNVPGVSGSPREILDQIFTDNVHLTPMASFFIGTYAFGEIFNQSAEGTGIPPGVARQTGDFLLQLAWSLVKEYRANPDNGIHDMADCRTHIREKICAPFWMYFSDDPGGVKDCRTRFGTDNPENPFRWPDSNLRILPSPQ